MTSIAYIFTSDKTTPVSYNIHRPVEYDKNGKQMHVANCEYLLLSISCEMNADQSLFVVDFLINGDVPVIDTRFR